MEKKKPCFGRGMIFRAASGVVIDINHDKIKQISTTQHYIDQKSF